MGELGRLMNGGGWQGLGEGLLSVCCARLAEVWGRLLTGEVVRVMRVLWYRGRACMMQQCNSRVAAPRPVTKAVLKVARCCRCHVSQRHSCHMSQRHSCHMSHRCMRTRSTPLTLNTSFAALLSYCFCFIALRDVLHSLTRGDSKRERQRRLWCGWAA
jgi:hypothetical protein